MFDSKKPRDKNNTGYIGKSNTNHTKGSNSFIGEHGPKLPNSFIFSQSNQNLKMFGTQGPKSQGYDGKNSAIEQDSGYIGDLNTEHTKRRNTFISGNSLERTVNFRYTKADKNQKMDSAQESNGPKGKGAPDKVSEMKEEDGIIEFGYNEKTGQGIVGAKDWVQSRPRETVVDDKSYMQTDMGNEKVRGNSRDLESSAINLKYDARRDVPQLDKKMEKFSKKRDYKTMLDKTVPFHQTETEKLKIEELQRERSKTPVNRREIDKQISKYRFIKREKERREIKFKQKLRLAVNEIKVRRAISFDEYLIYIRKKQEEYQGVADGDDNNKNKNDQNQKNNAAQEVESQTQEQQLEQSLEQGGSEQDLEQEGEDLSKE